MVGLKFTVWLIISVYNSGTQADLKKSGPFKVEWEKFSKCEDEGTGTVVLGTRITRTSDGGHIYNNTMYHGHPLDKDFKMYIELQSFSNGGYRPRYMHHTFKGCEEIWKYFQTIYKNFELDGKKIENCPIPAGNYSLYFDLDQDFVTNIRSLIYIKYKAVAIFYYNGEKVGCLNMYVEAVPKE